MRKKKFDFTFLKAIINIFMFVFFAAFIVALTNWWIEYFPDAPILFEIAWIFGVINLMALSLTKDWSGYLK